MNAACKPRVVKWIHDMATVKVVHAVKTRLFGLIVSLKINRSYNMIENDSDCSYEIESAFLGVDQLR